MDAETHRSTEPAHQAGGAARLGPGAMLDRMRALSMAETGRSTAEKATIRAIEWLTGKALLLIRLFRNRHKVKPDERPVWTTVLDILNITIATPAAETGRFPRTGPLVILANHPMGFVDGLAVLQIVGDLRPDLKILTRDVFARIPELSAITLGVAFPGTADAVERRDCLRQAVSEHLNGGGALVIFPAGKIAAPQRLLGKAIEPPWHAFTAQTILRSRARVVPVFIPGQPGALFRLAQSLSRTLRQGLLMREVRRAAGSSLAVQIGPVLDRDQIEPWGDRPREFAVHLRDLTLSLDPDLPTARSPVAG